MAELKILGAQRVKALQEILELQKKAELATVAPKYPEKQQVLSVLEQTHPGITAAYELVQTVFGYAPGRQYKDSPYDKAFDALTNDNKAERDAITQKYDDKARSLWLCETLEQAKNIVYGTTDTSKEGSA